MGETPRAGQQSRIRHGVGPLRGPESRIKMITRITALGRGWGGATRKKCPKKIKVSKYSMLYLEARAVRDKVE